MSRKASRTEKNESETDVKHYIEDGNPSEITDAAFVIATCKSNKLKPATDRIGKWLFFVAEKYIDDTWGNVKRAIEDGKLWKSAKVSTAWRSAGGVYVICVYTYDHEDETDVMKIRDYLREMGFKRPVSYKTDAQTLAGIYSSNTEGIAKYKA